MDLRLSFRERSLSLITSYTTAYDTSSSASSAQPLGLGTDFARFLTWLGSHVLDAVVQSVIRFRLAAVRKTLLSRAKLGHLTLARKFSISFKLHVLIFSSCLGRQMLSIFFIGILLCTYFLLTHSSDYPLKIRKKSLKIIFTLFRGPIDQFLILLLQSDFVEMLTTVTDDSAAKEDEAQEEERDPVPRTTEVIHIANAFRALPCHLVIVPSVSEMLAYVLSICGPIRY